MGKQQRNTSFGQEQKLSIVDIFGKYLSEREIAKTFLKHRKVSMMLLDVGCGYHASILRRFSPLISHGVVVDMSVSEQVKLMNNVTVYEQPIVVVLPTLEFASFDAILMNSCLLYTSDAADE